MTYRYRETVRDELLRHGVIPSNNTPPELIHEFVNNLYVYEIRSLRRRLKAGAIAMSDYAAQVEILRNRYRVLSLPIRFWIESD